MSIPRNITVIDKQSGKAYSFDERTNQIIEFQASPPDDITPKSRRKFPDGNAAQKAFKDIVNDIGKKTGELPPTFIEYRPRVIGFEKKVIDTQTKKIYTFDDVKGTIISEDFDGQNKPIIHGNANHNTFKDLVDDITNRIGEAQKVFTNQYNIRYDDIGKWGEALLEEVNKAQIMRKTSWLGRSLQDFLPL